MAPAATPPTTAPVSTFDRLRCEAIHSVQYTLWKNQLSTRIRTKTAMIPTIASSFSPYCES